MHEMRTHTHIGITLLKKLLPKNQSDLSSGMPPGHGFETGAAVLVSDSALFGGALHI